MPQEHRKRGRRAERKQRETQDPPIFDDARSKRRKIDVSGSGHDAAAAADMAAVYSDTEQDMTYFGTLSEQEQEYFKGVQETLQLNHFQSAEERELFLNNINGEAAGLVLKLACSQSCSRLLETMLSLANTARLNQLSASFGGQYIALVRHRFASHCCETLFLRAACLFSEALGDNVRNRERDEADELRMLQSSLLACLAEIEPEIASMISDKFAAHPVSYKTRHEKTKKFVAMNAARETKTLEPYKPTEAMSDAVAHALQNIAKQMDDAIIRTFLTHPIANPSLQSLLRLEIVHMGKQHAQNKESLLQRLVPLNAPDQGGSIQSYYTNLAYDRIGSRLLEVIIQCSPGKTFKALFSKVFRDKMGLLARHDVAGHITSRILERLSPEDLQHSAGQILPQIPGLASRQRTDVVKTLVERSVARGLDLVALAATIAESYSDEDGRFSLDRLLHNSNRTSDALGESTVSSEPFIALHDSTSNSQVHAAVLAQSLLDAPPELSNMMYDAITRLEQEACLSLATQPHYSRVLQRALTSPRATTVFRRKLITKLLGQYASLSTNVSGSHLVDAVWTGSNGLPYLRERVAAEMLLVEHILRESKVGRAVWRNWRMDLFKRCRGDWMQQAKEQHNELRDKNLNADADTFSSKPQIVAQLDGAASGKALVSQQSKQRGHQTTCKTSLQLARERFAKANGMLSSSTTS